MKKIIWIIIGLLLVAGLGWLIYNQTSQPTATEENQNQVKIGYKVESLNNGPLIIAYKKGYFQEAGLAVELIPTAGSEELALALSNGQVDIGSGSIGLFINAIDQGAPIRLTNCNVLTTNQLLVRADSGLKNLVDLQGKTVISHGGNGADIVFLQALRQHNIDPATITFQIGDRSTELLALTSQKTVAANLVTQREVPKYEEAGAIIMEGWANDPTINKVSPGIIAMNADFLNSHSEIAEKFYQAYIKGFNYIAANPETAAAELASYIAEDTAGATVYTVEEILAQWDSGETDYILWQDPSELTDFLDEMYRSGFITQPLTTNEIFDLRFQTELKNEPEN